MPSTSGKSGSGYLTGQLLIAMPQMTDPRFERTVIYICAHTADGAMGLVVNREIEALTFPDLLKQLSIDAEVIDDKIQVLFGGPVETGRGFVLHSSDYVQNTTMLVDKRVGLTATMEVLKDIASGNGPKLNILALGYAGWGPGQLDAEIQANGWLSVPADDGLVFDPDLDKKWERALAKIGVDFSMLSGQAGHA
ncbi:MAG: YqgE/AlgH family protein [Proteobacteria bacterium]|nr:YqgE/AlgH family protein [Pseudomonadota bacterium]